MYDLRVSCVHRRLYVTVEFGDQASYLQQETQPQAMQSAVQPTSTQTFSDTITATGLLVLVALQLVVIALGLVYVRQASRRAQRETMTFDTML